MVFILDEFGLPDGDPGRCSAMLERDLLSLLQERPEVDRLDPTAPDSSEECDRFAATVASGGLQLTLLGVGTNGHLGLNEPGSTPESTTRRVALSEQTRSGLSRYGVEAETDWGLTLGLREILASQEIWLLVRGVHKAEVLSQALNGPIGSEIPVTYLREAENVTVWADESAAAQI
jgi:glucosamine-6-phosphate deaminase